MASDNLVIGLIAVGGALLAGGVYYFGVGSKIEEEGRHSSFHTARDKSTSSAKVSFRSVSSRKSSQSGGKKTTTRRTRH